MNIRRLSAVALAATLSFALVSPAVAGPAEDALKFVPADSIGVISIDLGRIKGSAIYKQLSSMAKGQPGTQAMLGEVKSKLGVDIEKDVDLLVIAVPKDVEKTQAIAVIAHGKLNQKAITEAVQKAPDAKAKAEKHNGVDWMSVDGGKGGFAFVNGFAVMGSTEGLKRALDASKGKNLAGGGALKGLMGKVKRDGDLWAVMNITDEMRAAVPDPKGKSIQSVRASLDLAKGLALLVDVVTNDAKQAKAMADEVTGQINGAGAPPMFASLLKKITAKANGKDMTFAVNFSQAEVAQIQGLIGMAMMGGMGGGGMGGPGGPGMAPPPPAK